MDEDTLTVEYRQEVRSPHLGGFHGRNLIAGRPVDAPSLRYMARGYCPECGDLVTSTGCIADHGNYQYPMGRDIYCRMKGDTPYKICIIRYECKSCSVMWTVSG